MLFLGTPILFLGTPIIFSGAPMLFLGTAIGRARCVLGAATLLAVRTLPQEPKDVVYGPI